MLEAGPKITDADFTEHVMPYDLKYRGNSARYVRGIPKSPELMRNRPVQGLVYACRESNYEWFADDIRNPYQTPDDKPFHWIRMRVLGGRSLSWGRQSYRMGDIDFRCADRDGYGENWGIEYEDLVPYYEKVERYIGIGGIPEGLDHLPDSVFMPPMPFTCGEKLFRSRLRARMGRVATIGRTAIITKPLNGRQPCHYCGPCEQGCITHSYYNSPHDDAEGGARDRELRSGRGCRCESRDARPADGKRGGSRLSGPQHAGGAGSAGQGSWCCAPRRWNRRACSCTRRTTVSTSTPAECSAIS